jgi:hypothetical protein
MIAVKSLPQGMIADLQSHEQSAPAPASPAVVNGATNLETASAPDGEATKKMGTLNLDGWFSTPNIVDIDEMLIGI